MHRSRHPNPEQRLDELQLTELELLLASHPPLPWPLYPPVSDAPARRPEAEPPAGEGRLDT